MPRQEKSRIGKDPMGPISTNRFRKFPVKKRASERRLDSMVAVGKRQNILAEVPNSSFSWLAT